MNVITNPDKEYVELLKKALKANNGYCPNALIRSKDTKCPCKEFREMQEGTCYCGLYIKYR